MNEAEVIELERIIEALNSKIAALERELETIRKARNSALDVTTFANLPLSASLGKTYLVIDRAIGAGAGVVVYWDSSNWIVVATGAILV